MNKFLNILSITGSFTIVFGILFLIQEYTFGQIHFINKLVVFNVFPIRYLLFTAISIIFILKFINFHIPEREQ